MRPGWSPDLKTKTPYPTLGHVFEEVSVAILPDSVANIKMIDT